MKNIQIISLFIALQLSIDISFSNEDGSIDNLSQEETIERLIETDLIKDKYAECVSEKAPEPWNCVWEEKLKPAEQDQVAEILGKFNNKKDQGKPKEGNKYEGKGLGLFHEKTSPVMKKLGDNLFDMFQEAMYGEYTAEMQKKELRLVDHAVFYDIYKARISKEFIELVASFCLDSTKSGSVYTVSEDEDKLKKVREDNIKKLHSNPEGEKAKFNICIVEIKNICTHKSTNGVSCNKVAGKDIACAKDENTQNRACEVQQAVNAVKKNIAATEIIQKEIEKDADKQNGEGNLGDAITNQTVSIYNGSKMGDRQSVDTMTTVTSGQLEKAMRVDDETTIFDETAKKLEEECVDSLTKNCKEYVLEGDEIQDAKDKIAEMGLRMIAMEKRVNDNLSKAKDGDKKAKDELTQFLKEEGINEEDIEAIMSDTKKIKIVTDQIISNYSARKNAVINNLNNQLTKMIPEDDTDQKKLSIISQVREELLDRPKHYQQLLHYSNIISSYLSTSSSSGPNEGENNEEGQSIQIEGDQNNRYKTAAAKELGSLGATFADAGKELIKKVGIEADEDPDTDKEGLISVGLDTINSFLYKEVLEGKD